MSLSQSIVIKSEFSIPDGRGGGSRGATPGKYVTNYVSRAGAVESMAPVLLSDEEGMFDRHARYDDLTDGAVDLDGLSSSLDKADGLGGVAFGGHGESFDVSLSDEAVRDFGTRVQRMFDVGKTFIKTIVSFDEGYLREHGVLSDDFSGNGHGRYRGHVDQLKLRTCVGRAMSNLSRDYDDLAWIGVFHLDTDDLHCHLVMLDEGPGTLAHDGTQRGMLSQQQMLGMREDMDEVLVEMSSMRTLTSEATMDRLARDVRMVRFGLDRVEPRGFVQRLFEALPSDRGLWRVGSGDLRMAEADDLSRNFVQGLVGDASSSIVDGCVGALYESVVGISPGIERSVSSLFDGREDDDAYGVGMTIGRRIHAYRRRRDTHARRRDRWQDAAREVRETSGVSDGARALLALFDEEAEYEAMLEAKYRMLLPSFDEDVISEYSFDEVYALDLHQFDFVGEVSDDAMAEFSRRCDEREHLLDEALEYLRMTDQMSFASELPVDDIRSMRRTVTRLDVGYEVEVVEPVISSGRSTISLDVDVLSRMESAVLEYVS